MDENKDIATKNYITKLSTGVDLTKQILDFPKTEVTIGKVYDKDYKEEQLLNGESIAVQIVGKQNTPSYDDEGNLESVDVEETFKIQINVKGEIIMIGSTINLNAKNIFLDGEPGVKGKTLQNWCNTHTHSNGNNGSPTGTTLQKLPKEALANVEQ